MARMLGRSRSFRMLKGGHKETHQREAGDTTPQPTLSPVDVQRLKAATPVTRAEGRVETPDPDMLQRPRTSSGPGDRSTLFHKKVTPFQHSDDPHFEVSYVSPTKSTTDLYTAEVLDSHEGIIGIALGSPTMAPQYWNAPHSTDFVSQNQGTITQITSNNQSPGSLRQENEIHEEAPKPKISRWKSIFKKTAPPPRAQNKDNFYQLAKAVNSARVVSQQDSDSIDSRSLAQQEEERTSPTYTFKSDIRQSRKVPKGQAQPVVDTRPRALTTGSSSGSKTKSPLTRFALSPRPQIPTSNPSAIPALTVSGASQTTSPRTAGIKPLLDVDIPNVHMERYSVMFSGLLQPQNTNTSSSLLQRRQGNTDKLKPLNALSMKSTFPQHGGAPFEPVKKVQETDYPDTPSLSRTSSPTSERSFDSDTEEITIVATPNAPPKQWKPQIEDDEPVWEIIQRQASVHTVTKASALRSHPTSASSPPPPPAVQEVTSAVRSPRLGRTRSHTVLTSSPRSIERFGTVAQATVGIARSVSVSRASKPDKLLSPNSAKSPMDGLSPGRFVDSKPLTPTLVELKNRRSQRVQLVFAAVAAVISAFHGGVELVTHVKKKAASQSSDLGTEEDERRQLQVSLETAELQLGFRFSTEEARFGDIVRVGDGLYPARPKSVSNTCTDDNTAIARDRLLHIAVVIQTDIIMSLQLASKYENAVVDFKLLQVAAVANRRDAIDALDELKQRIFLRRPSLSTFSGSSNFLCDTQGCPESPPASRSVSSCPVSEISLPNTVSSSANGDSMQRENGLSAILVRYFYEKKRGTAVSNTSNYFHLLDSAAKSNNFRPALHYLLRGKSPEERALIMKDIDEIIAAYQGLRIEGDRADALARLTGNQEGSKRDTLAVLQGGSTSQRETKVLHQDALRLLKELPPLPKGENAQYPAYNHNILDAEDERRLSKWVEEQRQQPIPLVSRWSSTSAGSSTYSEHTVCSSDPPSLYGHDSRSSSRASTRSPAEPASPSTQYFPSNPNSTHGTIPFWSLDTIKDPPNNSSLASSRTNSPMRQHPSRSLTPTFGAQRPHTPTDRSRNPSPEPRGRSRVHLLPTDDWRYNTDTVHMLHQLRPIESSSQLSITPSVKSTVTTGAQEKMMKGRPCKDNNYWGFCKGAWATREDTKKGLALTSRPEGMFNTTQVWQCKHCLFEGASFSTPHPTKKNKKEVIIDPKIHVSATGIRYRWSFLAKSHVKKTNYGSGSRAEDMINCNYGCVICSMEGSVTGIYGSVETLMNHVAHEHIWTGGMNVATMSRNKIIVGRTASAEEDWDANIPGKEVLLF
ncbi:hypothetical protein N0V90_000948 [Kalmusia sp. IMI 367209]|nr:hypothetical protein N0V90_000948 [Kalmusia sp. IMI 367209]